jgi:hypothetical protein
MHDPERNALLVFPSGSATIERHQYNGSTWSVNPVTIPYNVYGAAMSPDGREVVVNTSDNRIVRLDAVTLAVITVTDPLTVYPSDLRSSIVTNDGNVLVSVGTTGEAQLYRYNLLNQTFTVLSGSTVYMSNSSGGASGDGSRAILKYDNSLTGANNVYTYNAGSGQFSPVSLAISGTLFQMDRTGSRMMFGNSTVYDSSFTLLGQVPYFNDGFNCNTFRAVISQSGTRAYAYCSFGTSGRVYTYDLTALPVGGYYPAIGSYLSAPYPITGLSISHDGAALFLIDTTRATVIPLP